MPDSTEVIAEAVSKDAEKLTLLRYPGGKQRHLPWFIHLLPLKSSIEGRFVEPFVGGGAVFFSVHPHEAVLSDLNAELIWLYQGIKQDPHKIWLLYKAFPSSKEGYYDVRSQEIESLDIFQRASRTLYLNRTCFKGMWRHNTNGAFNVGYGGQDRRWVISENDLIAVSKRLQRASLQHQDFELTLDACKDGDFVFLDPPYKPGEKNLLEQHYICGRFLFEDQVRLANALQRLSKRQIKWAMTNSSHPDILALYQNCTQVPLVSGTGQQVGQIIGRAAEVLIKNY